MTPADLERFQKICGLLGSEHGGERAAAALKATEWLREHGLTWADVTVIGGAVDEVDEAELLRRRREVWRENQRRRHRQPFPENPPSATTEFYENLRDDIRRATGGEDGLRDPRMRSK